MLDKLFKKYNIICGIDEAGRGPLAGPVVAACVFAKQNEIKKFETMEIKDSKKLSPKKREHLYKIITNNFKTSIGLVENSTIDRINILQASFLAMKLAFEKQNIYSSCYTLVDGNQTIPDFHTPQKAIINGDKLIPLISAASILAKVTRDQILVKISKKYPNYEFHQHKGYGTKKHLAALKKFGPCEIHRKSFKPVKNILK